MKLKPTPLTLILSSGGIGLSIGLIIPMLIFKELLELTDSNTRQVFFKLCEYFWVLMILNAMLFISFTASMIYIFEIMGREREKALTNKED